MIGIDTGALIAFENKSHTDHAGVVAILREARVRGESLAMCPQVVSEFLHVVTDSKRFATPLTMRQALDRMQTWRSAQDVRWVYPDDQAFEYFSQWMKDHQLGRKRILDTMLAATYRAAGVDRLLTSNQDDFRIFAWFEFI